MLRRITLVVLALGLAAVVAACGGDGSGGTGTDRAFAAEMVPHHESAVEMAEEAVERGEHPEIVDLAEDIVASQNEEIETLRGIESRLAEAGVEPGDLGMEEHEMGMDMDASMLEMARQFDRDFIDMMIPHHQGAIEMARRELAEGGDEEARGLAQDIIDAQAAEIEQMNEWREEWYGEPSPAGGVPREAGAGEHAGR